MPKPTEVCKIKTFVLPIYLEGISFYLILLQISYQIIALVWKFKLKLSKTCLIHGGKMKIKSKGKSSKAKPKIKTEKEKPIEVKPYKSKGHRLETRIFKRNIHETFCVQPRCKFRGRHAAQGICFDRETISGLDYKNLEIVEKKALESLAEMKEVHKANGGSWVKYLEGQLVCQFMNEFFTLDELVRLRMANADLRLKLGTYK